MLDGSGNITSWTGAERVQGYREAEALGLPLSSFFRRDERWKASAALEVAARLIASLTRLAHRGAGGR